MVSHEGDLGMVTDTDEKLINRVCEEVTFDGHAGFGYGSGTISRVKQLESGELTADAELKGADYIQHNPEAFIPIDTEATDDGCGDGRVAAKIYQVIEVMGERQVVEYKTSLNRAKVFGGGIVMTQAALLATKTSPATTADELFSDAEALLNQRNIAFGAHTDQHAHGDNCGCGAIDKMPVILANITRYDKQIQETLQALLGADFSQAVYDTAEQNMKQAFMALDFDGYAGSDTMDKILDAGAVVKQLNGDHQEDFVVLNFHGGTTFNQRGFFEHTDNQAQAFCVDVWRLQKYAEAVGGEDASAQAEALYGMLIYTLATSATLTDGSQRIFANQAA